MRRKEKQIVEITEIESIILRCPVCRIGLCDSTEPYVVPVNFGYVRGTLWVHSAREGRKIEILRRNPRVCVEFDLDFELKTGPKACNWSARYRSVLAFGTAIIIDDPALKRRGLDIIMAHYSGDSSGPFDYDEADLERMVVIRIDIDRITGKQSL